MSQDEYWKLAIILFAITLLIGWNYWIPLFFFSSPFSLLGGGSGDFHIFYLAGKSWLLGINPYLPNSLIGGNTVFIYPPTSLPFFGAYSLLDFRYSSQLWVISYYTLFLGALAALAYAFVGPRRVLFISISTILFFTSYPLLVLVQLGQSDLLVSSLAMLSLAAMKLNHRFTSAIFLSLSVLVKGPPAALLLIYFVIYSRNARYFLEFLAVTAALTLASVLVVPPSWFVSYAHNIISVTVGRGLQTAGGGTFGVNQSIVGLLPLLNLSRLRGVVSAMGYTAFALFAWKYGRTEIPKSLRPVLDDGMFLLNGLVVLLFDPRATIYPYVWVILPLGIFLSGLLVTNVRLAYLALAGVGALFLNANVAPQYLNVSFEHQVMPLNLVGNLLVTALLIIGLLKPRIMFRQTTPSRL